MNYHRVSNSTYKKKRKIRVTIKKSLSNKSGKLSTEEIINFALNQHDTTILVLYPNNDAYFIDEDNDWYPISQTVFNNVLKKIRYRKIPSLSLEKYRDKGEDGETYYLIINEMN